MEEKKRGSEWAEGEVGAPGKKRDAAGSQRTQAGIGSAGAEARSELSLGPRGRGGGTWDCLADPVDSSLSGNLT